jgi:4-oxalocrotonate tautomerase
MPVVTVDLVAGRTNEQKSKIADAITKAMSEIGGAKPEAVYVVFNDVERDDWASGGKLLSEG